MYISLIYGQIYTRCTVDVYISRYIYTDLYSASRGFTAPFEHTFFLIYKFVFDSLFSYSQYNEMLGLSTGINYPCGSKCEADELMR